MQTIWRAILKRSLKVAAGMLLLAGSTAFAQYPDRVVRIVNPYAVGGSVDTLTRLFAQKVSERHAQRIAVFSSAWGLWSHE